MAAGCFERALALVLDLEGGFVQDPRDPGGATNLGITRATLGKARGRAVSVADVKALTRDEAAPIYRRLYWDAVRADELPPGLDLAVFDYAVNSGPARAVRTLQSVLGVAPDGKPGRATLDAAAAAEPGAAIRSVTRERLRFLRSLSTWPAFGRGWTSRTTRVEAAALAAAATAPAGSGRRPTPPTTSPAAKEKTMPETKNVLASRTVWANLIGLASVGLGMLGVKTGSIDANSLADAAAQLVAGGSFIASTVFRMQATKQIGAPQP